MEIKKQIKGKNSFFILIYLRSHAMDVRPVSVMCAMNYIIINSNASTRADWFIRFHFNYKA